MDHERKDPGAYQRTGSEKSSIDLGSVSPILNPATAQAVSREMLRQNIAENAELLIAQLGVVLAMARVGNDQGFIYGLRCSGAYWRALAASTRDLIASACDGEGQ
jgi:hypothetical protein